MTPDPSPLLANPLLYTVVGLALVVIALSKKVEDSPILRWVRGAFSWAATRQTRVDDATMESVRREVAKLSRRVGELDIKLEAQATELQVRDEYIDAVTAWYRRLREWATTSGYELPPPPLQIFSQWRRAREHPTADPPPAD